MIEKIISGGQTGADQGALAAAKQLGLKTGGWMPKGFRTDDGPRPAFAQLYGMREHDSDAYPARTESNVIDSDGTLVFGNPRSSGCRLTLRLCAKHKKPVYTVLWSGCWFDKENATTVDSGNVLQWVKFFEIKTLNVVGNRESKAPGIFEATREYIIGLLVSDETLSSTH